MKVLVVRLDGNGVDTHEADWVDAEVGNGGVLRINTYNERDGFECMFWEVYAHGAWASFKLAEPPTAEIARRGIAGQATPRVPNGGTFGRR